MSWQFDSAHAQQYAHFENANGLLLNSVPLTLLGEVAFENLRSTFSGQNPLYICDVGCYWGATSRRWSQHGDDTQVLGTDIYKENIEEAAKKHQNVHNLQFKHMQPGGAIPLLDGKAYHGMFATFVLDTILNFGDVEQLCRNMVNALLPLGEIYILRLHPKSLHSQAHFQEYRLSAKTKWAHGDQLMVQLVKSCGTKIEIEDRYWDPEHIKTLFTRLGCVTNLIEVSLHHASPVRDKLYSLLQQWGIASDLPEWNVPLYQFIHCQKRA